MSVLVIAEHTNTCVKETTLNAITAAKELGEVTLLVVGVGCIGAAKVASNFADVKKVLVADNEFYGDQLAENIGGLIVSIARTYSHIIAPATANGRNLMPRVAALLDIAQISDVVKIESADTFIRPIYAGNALVTVQSYDEQKVLTVRPSAFCASAREGGSADIVNLEIVIDLGKSKFLNREHSTTSRPDLLSSRIVISGGRGMADSKNFAMLETLASKMGAAIGASRAAVDAGYAPNELQIGQTGKVVAPELYIAVGISGAIQHLAGMKDSKIIVAINNDEDAPIFEIADYGLVGDLFDVLPKLERILN